MKLILALDTSTDVCSVALGTTADYVELSHRVPKQHNEKVLPMIERLFAVTGHTKNQLSCVAFGAGPGSFTGIRLSAAVAQGIALGMGCQIYRAKSSAVLAAVASRTIESFADFQVVRHSRRTLHYWADVGREGTETIVQGDEILREGDGFSGESVIHDSIWQIGAREILRSAAARVADWEPPERAVPLYVAEDSPWSPQA